MDKAIKKHFDPMVKTRTERKLEGQMLKTDKKLDASIAKRTGKKGK